MSDADRRAHLRYRDPDSTTVRLTVEQGAVERPLTALLVNESYSGLACVYVGAPLEVDSELLWRETRDISTPCRVTRCEALHTDVYLLGLQILG